MTVEVEAMEVKKAQQLTTNSGSLKETAVKRKRLREFIADIKSEVQKITWTNPEELKAYTKIVVGATLICGIGLYGMDLTIQALLYLLESALRVVTG